MSTPDTQMNQYLTTIAEAVHGRDMRAAIHDGLEKTYNDAYTWFNQSLGNANQALQKATEALNIAEPMGDDIQEVKDLAEDLDTKYDETNERVNNIIAHNNDTDGNSELIDIRTTYNGQVKSSAGSAVRSQISALNSRVDNLVREQSTGELEDCHVKPVYVPLYENQYPSSAFAAQTLQLSLSGSPAPSLAKYALIKITFKDSNLFGAGVRSVYMPMPGYNGDETTAYSSDGFVTMTEDGTYGLDHYARRFEAVLSSSDTVLNIIFSNCTKIATDNPFAISNSDMTISDPSSTTSSDNEHLIPYEIFLIDCVLDGEIEVDKDTELIDIRNGEDGTTYSSAGAAVRGQVVSAKNKTASTQSMIAPLYSVSGTYAVGDYVNYGDKLYKAKQAVSSEAWTPSHWQEVNVMDEVDSDVGELKSALDTITGNTAIGSWTAGSLTTNDETVDITDIKNLTSYRHVILSVVQGDVFTINATGGGNPRAWCFTDSSYNVLSNSAASVTLTDAVIVAPASAAYLIINDNNTGGVCLYGASIPQRFNETNRTIEENANEISRINTELNTETGLQPLNFAGDNKYIRVNYTVGTIVSLTPQTGSSALGYKYSLIAVAPGDVFTISASNVSSGVTNAEAKPIAVLDSSNVLLYVAPSGTLDKTEFTIPENGEKLIINTCSARVSYKGISRITTAESNISNIVAMNDAESANTGNLEYFINAELKDLLTVEKMSCIHHDNFHRENNSTDIGYNGNSTIPMSYTRLNTSGGDELAVGIYNNKAAFTNPSSLANSTVVLETIDVGQYLYKISVSVDEFGVIVVGVLGATSYVRIDIKPNIISISPTNTTQITESKSFTHNMGKGIADIYMYKDKIICKVFGITVITVDAKMESTVCGMLFRAGDVNTSYNMFNVFTPDKFENNAIDYIIERTDYSLNYDSGSGNYSNPLLGIVQKSTDYGMTNDTSITNMSKKSLRFELRQTDPISNASKRAELVPKNPKLAYHALQTKIFDFDVYFPSDYADESISEIFLQMHDRPDGVNVDGLNPGIEFETKSGEMRMVIKGSASKMTVNNAEDHVYTLGVINKGAWTHFTIFMREGYMEEHFPVVAVWVDKDLKAISYDLNAYNELYGSYLKFGMYKPAWKTAPTTVDTRVIYFDNFVAWQ